MATTGSNWPFGPDVFLHEVDLRPGESASEVGCRFDVGQGCIDSINSSVKYHRYRKAAKRRKRRRVARSLSLHPLVADTADVVQFVLVSIGRRRRGRR